MSPSRRIIVLGLPASVIAIAAAAPPAMARNVEQYNAPVRAVGHKAAGRAAVVRQQGGPRFLTLTRFSISPGPRVKVYLVAGRVRGDGDVDDVVDLGTLKGSRGDQQYRIPAGTNVRKYRTVVFWCVPFTQILARADLRPS
jgi:hypothetical protein